MRPVAREIGAGDFAFAAGHRLTAISLLAGILNSAAAFSIAVASSAASTVPRTALAAISAVPVSSPCPAVSAAR
jgi:hypothetical protein